MATSWNPLPHTDPEAPRGGILTVDDVPFKVTAYRDGMRIADAFHLHCCPNEHWQGWWIVLEGTRDPDEDPMWEGILLSVIQPDLDSGIAAITGAVKRRIAELKEANGLTALEPWFKPEAAIVGTNDVLKFFRDLLKDGINFHPDDDFRETIDYATKARVFTDEQAERLNSLMAQATALSVDVYELAQRAHTEHGLCGRPSTLPNRALIGAIAAVTALASAAHVVPSSPAPVKPTADELLHECLDAHFAFKHRNDAGAAFDAVEEKIRAYFAGVTAKPAGWGPGEQCPKCGSLVQPPLEEHLLSCEG
jgi:hypothetical protein